MSCLCCRQDRPLDLFSATGKGRRRICDDCFDTGAVTDAARRLARRINNREYMRRKRYPWYAAAP